MFGRTKDHQPSATTVAPTDPSGAGGEGALGKGRPTPKRREAESRNRRVIGAAAGPAVPANATKAERKALKKARRDVAAKERLLLRQALATGDEKALPMRDRGPGRRWARDYIDARLNPGEFFLPAALLFVVLGVFGDFARFIGTYLFYGLILLLALDSYLLRRRVTGLVTTRFGAEQAKGVGTYAMTRALQLRRFRLPKPQVKRGEKPS